MWDDLSGFSDEMDREEGEYCAYPVTLVRETAKAYLVEQDGKQCWLPKSKVVLTRADAFCIELSLEPHQFIVEGSNPLVAEWLASVKPELRWEYVTP